MVETLDVTAEVRAAIVRVLGPEGTAGTGFVVDRGRRLIATCAHVVRLAGVLRGGEIGLVHLVSGAVLTAEVLPEYWREVEAEDVALLRVHGDLPPEATEVMFGATTSPVGHKFWTFGFPPAKELEGLVGTGTVAGEIRDEQGLPVLQLERATAIVPGFSGAPLLDRATRRVAGMVVAITEEDHGRLTQTAFAIPTATLLAIDPGLKASDIAPYRALDVFEKEDAWLYFGRSGAVEQVVAELRRSQRFLAVLGPSGSGKSSLVRAGVIPAVEDGAAGSDGWGIVVTRPADLLSGLAGVALSGGPGGVRRWLDERPGVTKLLLVIDQFEEAFVDLDPHRRGELLRAISAVVASTAPATVVVTMRDEFFSQFVQQAPSLTGALKDGLHLVPPILTRNDLTEIVAEPARLVGVGFADHLVERIVDDAVAAAPGVDEGTAASTVLPLLEFTLAQLWEKREDGVMTHSRYEAVGKVTGGIATWAEDALDRMGEADLPTVRTVFSGLVHLGDDRQGIPDSRWRRPLSSLARQPGEVAQVTEVVRRLADERLVVTSYDRDGGIERVELIHDALVREWDRLRRWLDEDRRFLTWQQELERQRQRWQEDSAEGGVRDTGKLLRGRDLDTALHFQHESDARLTDEQRAFIAESKEQRRRSQRLRRYAIAGLAILTVVALVAAAAAFALFIHANSETAKAQANAQQALALGLVSDANDMIAGRGAGNDVQAFQALLAAQALGGGDRVDSGLLNAILQNQTTAKVVDTGGPVGIVAFSAYGHRLATLDRLDGTVRVWDTNTGVLVGQPLTAHTGQVDSVALSPDGRSLATGGVDGAAVHLWDVDTGNSRRPPIGPDDAAVFTVAFSPNGDVLASGSCEGTCVADNNVTLRFFNATTGAPVRTTPLVGFTGSLHSLVFSPDFHRVATGNDDGSVQLWSADDGTLGPTVIPKEKSSFATPVLAISPNSQFLAISAKSNEENAVRLWNATTGQLITLPGHTNSVTDVAFSADGQRLASASYDNTVRLWDTGTGQPIGDPLSGHTRAVNTVAFSPDSPDGHLLATGSDDNTLRMWNLDAHPPLAGPSRERRDIGDTSVAFSPDGHGIATGTTSEVQLWNADKRTHTDFPVFTGEQSTGFSQRLEFSSDGQRLILAGEDHVWILDLGTGQPADHPLHGQAQEQYDWQSVAISPDGHRIATAGYVEPRTIPGVAPPALAMWDADTGELSKSWPAESLSEMVMLKDLVFSSDGRLAASDTEGTVRIWDANTTKPVIPPLKTNRGNANCGHCMAFSPNGRRLATGNLDGTVGLYDADTGHPLGLPLSGHTKWVSSVAFTPNGRRLASGGADNTVRLWDVDTGEPITTLTGHQSDVGGLAFSERLLVSSSEDGTVQLWPATGDPQTLCKKLSTNMSPKQWNAWVSSDIKYNKELCQGLPRAD